MADDRSLGLHWFWLAEPLRRGGLRTWTKDGNAASCRLVGWPRPINALDDRQTGIGFP